MADSFFDEILNVTLKFSNPNRRDMEDADKVAAKLSMSLDGVIRKSVSAGKGIHEITEAIKQLDPALKKLGEKSGGVSASANALLSAQKILARYTPARLEKMAEVQSSKIAETSGTAALRRELQKNGSLMQRLIATQQGQYDRATRGSHIGRAMFLDTETTGLNPLKHQIVELTATLFTFNKKTGEIINAAERTYSGLQALAHGGRNVRLPQGLSQEHLAGQAISTTLVRRMMQQADFIVAHNSPFDKKFVERLVPHAASMPWMDSMRGVPWRALGYNSRAQQDLLRGTGINPGAAHRSSSDVSSAIQLLGSRSQLGGGTFLSMLMGNQGPLNSSQQTLAVVKHLAEEIRVGLNERLGTGKSFDPVSAKHRATIENYATKAADDVAEIFSQYVVDSIEGGITARSRRPARSTDYGTKFGSGYSENSTPGQLGPSAISIDRRLGTATEFLRNMSIMSGPASSSQFLKIYEDQQKFQEKVQQGRGRGRQIKDDIRSGEEVSLASMQGVNTYFHNKREGIIRRPNDLLGDLLEQSMHQSRVSGFEGMLSQPWAKSSGGFDSKQIDSFISTHKSNPSVGAIQTAAQMAGHVGPRDPRYTALGSILTEGQGVGRQIAAARAAKVEQDALNRLAGSKSSGKSGFRDVIGNALKGLHDAGLASAFTAVSPLVSAGGFGLGSFRDAFRGFSGRRGTAGSQTPVGESSFDIRTSMRQDAFEARLHRLSDAVQATAAAFERYRDIVAPVRRADAQMKADSREATISQGLAGTNLSLDSQQSRLDARRRKSRITTGRRLEDIQSGFDSKSSGLGFSELDAEMRYEDVLAAKKRKEATLKRSKAYQDRKLSDTDIESMLSGSVKSAQMRLTKAQYAYQSSQLTDPQQIADLRTQTAQKMALTRYGRGSESAGLRDEYANRVHNLLGGRTLAQTTEGKANRTAADQITLESELDSKSGSIRTRRQLAEDRATQKRAENSAKLGTTLGKIDDDVEKHGENNARKRSEAERKASELVVAHRKREQAILSGGGSGGGAGRGGSGGGGGKEADFASRSGFDLGLGLAAIVAYNQGLKELLKDTVIYAARTETLQLVTNQMAKVNGLNTDSVEAEVSAVKSLNITTQEANTTVQKMIFAQLDAAKATNLARTAQDAAILANVNSSDALDKIILGIVTGQTRVLHNMNLQVSMLQVMRELRADKKSRGESGDPTELEKRQAMLNKVLLEGAKIMGTYERSMLTAGKQFNSLQREVQEAQNAIGKEFLPEFGRFVSLTSTGLKYVQEHGDGFAKLASALVAVGSAASTVGTLSFIKWVMSTPAVPWWAKVGGLIVGGATYAGLNQDDAKSDTKTASEQTTALQKKIQDLRKERKRLMENRDGSSEWQTTWDQNTASLKSASNSEVAINEELTKKLAEQYNKRIEDLDDYINSMKGKNGLFWQTVATFKTSPENGPIEAFLRNIQFFATTGPEDIQDAEKQRSGLAGKLSTDSIGPKDITAAAAQQKLQQQRLKLLSPTLLNKEKMEVKAIIAEMTQADTEMFKLDEKLSETGSIGLRARKSMGTPREKANLDYERQIAQVKKLGTSITELRKKASAGDLASKSKLFDISKELGGGSAEVGEKKIEDFMSRRKEIFDAAAEDRDIQISKISRQNKAQAAQINEQTAAARIQVGVVEGNYESEANAIEKLFQLKQSTASKVKQITGDVDSFEKQVVQNKVDREVALIGLEKQRVQGARQRAEETAIAEGTFKGARIMESPINARDAIISSSNEELKSAQNITNEERKKDAILQINIRRREALAKLAFDEKKSAAEARVDEFESSQDLAMEIDRIVSSRGRTNNQRSLDEIERTRRGQVSVADKRFAELQPVTGALDQAALSRQHTAGVNRANNTAIGSTVKELDQQVESARTRLADTYNQRFQKVQRINELMAVGPADEDAAAANTHSLRMEYIQKEAQARGNSIESERIKNEQIQEADFDHLQKLLQMKKQETSEIRDFAGSVFDAATTPGGNGFRELAISKLKGLGRQVTQNAAGEYLQSARQNIGSIIPGQETTDAKGNKVPTALGKLLGGTFLSPASSQEDINKLLASVTQENTTAEQSLTEAIKNLDDALRGGSGGGSRDGVAGSGAGAALSKLGIGSSAEVKAITGILGGVSATNPLIFHNNLAGVSSGPSVGSEPAPNWNGLPIGDTGKIFTNGGTSAAPKTSGLSSVLGGFGAGATGQYNIADVFSGSSSVRTAQGATALTTGQRVGAMAGYAALIGGGLTTAYQGFKQGGARGIVGGIGGVLTAASAAPGPQQPFIQAAAMVAGLVKGLFPDAKEARQREIDAYLQKSKYIDPVQINREMSVSGNLLSYNKQGVARDTGTGAFPIDVQPNAYRQTIQSLGSKDPQYEYLPGRVLDNPNPPASAQAITINLPISAMDSKDVIARSSDIAKALHKELKLGNEVSLSIQQSVFGSV